MIGNDIIDLELAKTESNWKRKGFLDKLFSKKEQHLIRSSENPEQMVWILWSCKESVYKIYNRQTLLRAFIPLQLECDLENYKNETLGSVTCFGKSYFAKTETTQNSVYTIAVTNKEHFQRIKEFDNSLKIIKQNGIPFIDGNQKSVSITHHGKFDKRILLDA